MQSWSTFLCTWLQENHHPAVCHSMPFRLVVRQLAPQYQDWISALQFKSVPTWKWTRYLRESTLRSTNELLWHLQNCWFGSAERGVGMWTPLLLGRSLQCRVEKGRWIGSHYTLFILTRNLPFHSSAHLVNTFNIRTRRKINLLIKKTCWIHNYTQGIDWYESDWLNLNLNTR